MNVSENGLRLIAEFEGFEPQPNEDPAGNCTVGYGDKLHDGPCTDEERVRPAITPEQGFAYLRVKVLPYADAVERSSRSLTQNEFDALASFCYNVGQGGYIDSLVRVAVNAHGDVCGELSKVIHGNDGVAYPGLIRRRKAECALYSSTAPPGAISGGDEMWTRLNGISTPFEHRQFAPGSWFINVRKDFPSLPASARAVDLDVFLYAPATGALVAFKDSDGSYAGQVSATERHAVIRCVIGADGLARFDVGIVAIAFERIGILGYLT